MAARTKPKSRSGSYVPDDLRGTVRVVVRCTPEQAERVRSATERHRRTLAEVMEAGVRALDQSRVATEEP